MAGRCCTHSLLRRVVAVITGHSWRSGILSRRLHTLRYLLETILPHLNPLCHVTHRRVFCENQAVTKISSRPFLRIFIPI